MTMNTKGVQRQKIINYYYNLYYFKKINLLKNVYVLS